jgi:tetratricopeptide (TPR) repeat protein
VIDMAAAAASLDTVYLAAQSHQKQGSNAEAVALYARLAARPESDAWHFIGLSGRQLLEGQLAPSVASARQAVTIAPQDAASHYQLGLALARQEAWAEAAAAFDAAAERQRNLAYAHYSGGLMHYRANRPDRMAIHFDQFLKLAPDSPDRPEVVSIMRTIRRR